MIKMKAVVVDPNAPGHLAVHEVDRPVPAANEAIVRVAASSLNAGEVRMAQDAEAGQQVGWDVAGTVEQAAADGSGPGVGARVAGFVRTGAWAEFVAVPIDALAELPTGVSFVQEATLPVAGLTALHSVEKGTGLLVRKVLVTGASGGVGHFAVQLAFLSGAAVVAQVRRERHRALATACGAHEVVVSEDGSGAAEFGPYRLVVDGVGGQVLANALGMLAHDGVCVAFGASGGSEVTFDLWSLIGAGRASLYGLVLRRELVLETASEGLVRLADLVAKGRLEPHISLEESWSKIGEVAREFLDRKVSGKAVIHMI
jgi:NADPH:quinone reductase-like Zn-dependent oxidoreductase